jgi:hypothetical protein
MPFYQEYTLAGYIESKCTLAERIVAIDALIDKGILLMADTIDGAAGNIAMYELDDQQVRIKTNYRSIDQVAAGVRALERMKQLYVNKYNGRAFVLQDRGTFRG